MPKIKIENELFERIEQAAADAGYSSAEEFVVHVLEQLVNRPGENDKDEDIVNRLKGLGYID